MNSKKNITIVLIVLIVVAISVMVKGTRSVSSFVPLTVDDREVAKQAIIDEAYAFYHRGLGFNYDDNNITYLGGFVPSEKNVDDPNYNASVDHQIWKRRSSYYHQPEEAMLTDKKYLVCSEFVVNVYRNAFINQDSNNFILETNGEEIWNTYRFMKIANDEMNEFHPMTLYYYNVEDKLAQLKDAGCEGDECYNQLATEMQSIKNNMLDIDIQPGDLILYRSRKKCDNVTDCGASTGGHIMLYVEKASPDGSIPEEKKDRYVLHSTGSSYVYNEKYDSNINESNGTVQQITLDEAVDRVLKSGVDTTSVSTEIAILRPLDTILENELYAVSDNTSARRAYADLVRTKTSSVNKHDSVNPGDIITYTITLENRSLNEYSGINIMDTIPDDTTYISCTNNCAEVDGNLAWENISIPAGETREYSYTIKVAESAALGSEIISDSTLVAGIMMNTIKTTVNKTLTKTMQNNLVDRVKTVLSENTYSENDSKFALIVDAYDGIANINFGTDIVDVQTLFEKFYNITTDDVYVLKNNFEEDKYTNMYVKNLFGGYMTTYEGQYDLDVNNGILNGNQAIMFDGRELTYDNNTLMVGDVLLMYDPNYENENYAFSEYNSYLYLGYNESKDVVEFATIDDNQEVIIVDGKLDGTNRSRLLESLFGQNAFIVLRPSYSTNDDTLQVKGDVNSDGTVDIKDAIILAKYIIDGTSNYDYSQLIIGDMNNDGKIKMNDVIKILKSMQI